MAKWWANFAKFGLIISVVNGQILKNNRTIWSHWYPDAWTFSICDFFPISKSCANWKKPLYELHWQGGYLHLTIFLKICPKCNKLLNLVTLKEREMWVTKIRCSHFWNSYFANIFALNFFFGVQYNWILQHIWPKQKSF